ncbi:MAG: hypothetical protein Q7S83_00735 [bacterium]|nr:hypothetical protein [bacterium]
MNEIADDILMIAKVFAASIVGFLVLAGFFAAGEAEAILYGLLILANILLATLISVTAMVIMILLGGRFCRLF